MRAIVCVVTVVSLSSGCFGTHGSIDVDASRRPDASAIADAPTVDAVAPDAFAVDGFDLDVGDAASACHQVRADHWIAPAAVLVGDPIPVLMRADQGVGCGCTPHGELQPSTGPSSSLLACACADMLPCIDSGYDATVVADPSTSPTQRQFYHPYPGGRLLVEVVDGWIANGTIDALALYTPDALHRGTTSAHWWLRATGTEDRCCGMPTVSVRTMSSTTPGTFFATAMESHPDTCVCSNPMPAPFEAFFDLGALTTGHYVVRVAGASTVSTAFDVP